MNVIQLIIGIVLVLATGVSIGVSIVRTPDHLRGFYGAMFYTIGIFGFIGGILLVIYSFL